MSYIIMCIVCKVYKLSVRKMPTACTLRSTSSANVHAVSLYMHYITYIACGTLRVTRIACLLVGNPV